MLANSSETAAMQADSSKAAAILAGSLRERRVLGYRLHPMLRDQLLDLLFEACATRRRIILSSANLHGLYVFEREASYRALQARPETVVMIDGMPIVWLLRVLGHAVGRDHRTTWLDWFPLALARAAAEGRRVFILGHPSDVLSAGLAKARSAWPGLIISGHTGYFDASDNIVCERIVATVNAFDADIVVVGMGMPRQEVFVSRYGRLLTAPVVGLGGAAFGYVAGEQRVPPRWMGRAGLEWAHRLASDPARLAGRYMAEPFLLAWILVRRLTREKLTGRSSSPDLVG
jgi:N-acetylglucosaminyldiphosphoundecaprenol N-acetyl-beta-D-mannosaminyltransferase